MRLVIEIDETDPGQANVALNVACAAVEQWQHIAVEGGPLHPAVGPYTWYVVHGAVQR